MGDKGGPSEPELGKLGGSIAGAAHAAAPLPGAVWMTDNEGSHLNHNIYTSKDEVYLSGGPDNQGFLLDAALAAGRRIRSPDDDRQRSRRTDELRRHVILRKFSR